MLSSAVAVGYLRKSVAGRRQGDDKGLQLAVVQQLAQREGCGTPVVLDSDWGRSGGRQHRGSRTGMAQLLDMVRAGQVRVVLAYALDRLARDTEYGLQLWNACADQGVPIVVDGARYDTSDPADRMRFVILSELAAGELDRITKRNRDKVSRARATGGSIGGILPYGHDAARHPGEDAGRVVQAYRDAGSYMGAANLLNAAGVRPRRGGLWSPRSVLLVVTREAPDLARRPFSRKGVSAAHTRTFSGLLACHCGTVLTAHTRPGRPRADGSTGPSSQAYICMRGRVDRARHGRPLMVSEPTIMAWARVEAVRLRVPADSVERTRQSDARRARLEARLARATELYLAGDLPRASYDAERASARQQLDALEAERVVDTVPQAVDWTWPPATLNTVLRALWQAVQLGPDLRPVSATWAVPDWRASDDDAAAA